MTTAPLRYVILRGPQWGADGPCLWELQAAAPKLDAGGSVALEDRVHPLRVQQIDPVAGTGGTDATFRRPHVVSMHVLAGHGAGPFRSPLVKADAREDFFFDTRGYPPLLRDSVKPVNVVQLLATQESLRLALPRANAGTAIRDIRSELGWKYINSDDYFTMPPYWYTRRMEPGEMALPESPLDRMRAEFQHVVVAPALQPFEGWPPRNNDAIDLPPFNLVAGAIELCVAEGALPWLGILQPKRPAKYPAKRIFRYPVRLVPEGIELCTTVKLLDVDLEGWFRITPGPGTAARQLLLTLLPERTEEAGLLGRWLAAWAAAMPLDADTELLEGFRVAAHAGKVPAFRWTLQADFTDLPPRDTSSEVDRAPGNNLKRGPRVTIDFAKAPVEVPSSAIRLELQSPRDARGIDGVVSVSGGYYRLGSLAAMHRAGQAGLAGDYAAFEAAAAADSRVLAWWSEDFPAAAPDSSWKIAAQGQASRGELRATAGHYPCAHNERQLAARLRQAYGLAAPTDEPGDPAAPLYGFLPLSDGWLQVPFPDMPPQDPDLDTARIPSIASAPKNVISGFLRYGNAGSLPGLFSAFEPEPRRPAGSLVTQAPWQVTIEGAAGLRLAIELRNLGRGRVAPASAVAVFDSPNLSTRGLLWLSTDRPDGMESLPRPGAGPGAYIDIPMERHDREADPVVAIGIGRLAVASQAGPQGGTATVTREQLELTIDTRGDDAHARSVRWQRHPVMPLVAAMPLTRSASSAVRPMESRDLVPFIAIPPDGHAKRLAEVEWPGSRSLPSLADGWRYELLPEPSRPLAPAADPGNDADNESLVCRIAWAAVGVPGVEVQPLTGGAAWTMLAALRYDLPLNDQAYAMASLPPSAETVPPAPEPAITALNLAALRDHWREMRRLSQLCRTSSSYIASFKPEGDMSGVNVVTLVGGRTWPLRAFGFKAAAGPQALPYGQVNFDGDTWSGNRALRGFDGTLTLGSARVEVLGFSPASFDDGGYLTDARGVGAMKAKDIDGGAARWRPLQCAAVAGVAGLLGLRRPLAVDAGRASLSLWFRDVAIRASGEMAPPPAGVESDVWQDTKLPIRGAEWRLTSVASPGDGDFRGGRDTFAFFGMGLQPLRLAAMEFGMTPAGEPSSRIPESATVIGRLYLGPRAKSVDDGGNLVELDLVAARGGLALRAVRLHGGAPLRFEVPLRPQHGALRWVAVEADDVKWSAGALSLDGVRLSFEFLGRRVALAGATAAQDGDDMVIGWHAAQAAQTGQLSIRTARLHAGREAEFRLLHIAQLAKAAANGSRTLQLGTVERWGHVETPDGIPAELQYPGATLTCLGVTAQAAFHAGRHAFAAADLPDGGRSDTTGKGVLIPGFPSDGRLQFGLLATVGAFAAGGAAALDAVHLSGSLRWKAVPDGAVFALKAVAIVVEKAMRGTPAAAWRRELVLDGEVEGTSAIAWPAVTTPVQPVPVPAGEKPGQPAASTLTPLMLDADEGWLHEVAWRLDAHVMPFETAIGLANGEAVAWSVPAAAKHTLVRRTRAGERVEFASIDTLVFASMKVFAPRWDSAADDKKQGTTFVARFPAGASDSGMAWPGRAGLGTALRGMHGELFRRCYHGEKGATGSELVVAGGFNGIVAAAGAARAPLLKLPVLIGVDKGPLAEPGVLRQNGQQQLKVAWPDGMAAAEIAVPERAGTPESLSMRDIVRAAERARRPAGAASSPLERSHAAMLVEQCFPVGVPANLGLRGTPFFVGAIASLALAMRHLEKAPRARSYALVSLVDPVGDHRMGAAAILAVPAGDAGSAAAGGTPQAAVLVAGDDITCTSLPRAGAEPAPAAVREIAWTRHARPRLAMLRTMEGDWRPVELPQSAIETPARRVPAAMFADAARGFMLDPSDHLALTGPEEGATVPTRSSSAVGAVQEKSGLAALSRVARLPAFAGEAGEPAALAWLTQQRVPVYLASGGAYDAEPVAWLDPGGARVRVPVSDEVARSVDRALDSASWQPQLPAQVMTASVSDRPGVLVARRLRIEMPDQRAARERVDAFDAEFPRFGAPGQSSASLARTERTPRPGPLPRNVSGSTTEGSDPMLANRRPCVSRLLYDVNNRAVLGPADILSGRARIGPDAPPLEWTMVLVGLPRTRGVFSVPWDGTIELAAELTVGGTPLPSAASLLVQLLFAARDDASPASASLVVNGQKLPMRSLHVREGAVWTAVPGAGGLRRAVVGLVLDMREANAPEGPGADTGVLSSLLTADMARAPVLECQFNVHPGDQAHDGAPARRIYSLAPPSGELPRGASRAPVTLRIPLFVVTTSRGALPLQPSTVLFTDPSYDAGLASPPADALLRVALPPGATSARGDVQLVLSADRARINRQSTVTLMADLRFEKRLPPHAREVLGDAADGDFARGEAAKLVFALSVAVHPKAGPRRQLALSPAEGVKSASLAVQAGVVCELPLAWLVEADGAKATIQPGDVLELRAVVEHAETVRLLTGLVDPGNGGEVSVTVGAATSLQLRLTVTAEPVVEPPPGLYAALLRTRDTNDASTAALSVPLHAQSPLPTRVELPTARDDFRAGLMRRSATFAWSLVRPADEQDRLAAYVLKSDRNGQTYLPEDPGEFLRFDSLPP